MVSLSPLMSNFGALLEGLTTVRGKCTFGEKATNRLLLSFQLFAPRVDSKTGSLLW